MAKKLFGNNIRPECRYCAYCTVNGSEAVCSKKGKVDIRDKCIRFKYDPLMRVPELAPLPREYSPEEFKI